MSNRVVRNLHFHLTARAVRNTWRIGLLGIVLVRYIQNSAAVALPDVDQIVTAFYGQRYAQVQTRARICTSR